MNLVEQKILSEQDVLIVTDLYGAITSVSDSVTSVFGYARSALIAKNIELLVPVDLRSKHRDHLARYSHRPHARTMGIGLELNAIHADGSLVPVEVSLRVLRDPEQDLLRVVVRRSGASGVRGDGAAEIFARVHQLELTSRDISEVFELVMKLASSTYSDHPVAIWRIDPSHDEYVIESVFNLPDEFVGMVTPRHDDGLITQAVFVQGVSSLSGEGDGPRLPVMFRGLGYEGGIAATIGGRYEPFGAITVYFAVNDALTVSDAIPLQTFATELSRFILSTQTEEALTRESELQAKLGEIGRIFSSSHRVDDIYRTFATLVNDLIPHRRITLAEIDLSTRTITTKYSINSDGSDISGWETGTSHDLIGTSAEKLVETKTGLFLNFSDPSEFSRILPGAPDSSAGLTGVLNIPLIVKGVVVGTLTLNTSGDQTFNEESLRLGERIAAQISGSFLSASLSESLSKEATRRGVLNEVGQIIGSNINISDVFDRFADVLKTALSSDYVAITDIDIEAGTKLDYLVSGDYSPERVVEPLAGSISGLVAKEQRLIFTSSETTHDDPNLGPDERTSAETNFRLTGLRAWIAAPLMDHGVVIGVLHVLTSQKGHFDSSDHELVSEVASRISSAVTNSRLHEAAQEYARRQGFLAQISREIGSSLDSNVAFDNFVNLLSELIAVDRVAISNVDVLNQTGETLYVSGNAKLSGLERTSFRTGGTPTGYAADIGERVIINNEKDAARFENWVGNSRGIMSTVTMPMGRDGDFARVFQVSSSEPNAYDSEHVLVIEQVANQISGIIANQQLFRRSIELAQERERSIRLESETARLASVNEAKNDFLNLLTHELKTPLTSIIAFADLLVRQGSEELSARQSQQLKIIQRNAWQLDALIQDLVEVASIERGNIVLSPVDTDLDELVVGVLEGMKPGLDESGQLVDFVASDFPVHASVDRQRMTQIISNLVSNASKYSPRDTTIRVSVVANESTAVVTVMDEGPGIPEADLAKVFELFHRVDNENTRRVPGTGQGLYLVKQLVELHGGRVRIANRRLNGGTGARVAVEFPI